ncbi:MAG TPA: hypothetical protein VFI38_09990 [Candidatus Acidoferrum sp.]|nr:hypothetical protein [Candidatus Acidoferrum sp.]
MPTVILGLIVASLLVGFGRIVYEFLTGKFFVRGSKVYASRHQNPRLYWISVSLEILVALLVTSVLVMNWPKQ